MTEESKYLDTLFQTRFTGFEAEPPASVWENVHAELHGKGGSSINPVNLAVLAALLMIGGLLSFSIMKDPGSTAGISKDMGGQTAMLFDEPSLHNAGILELPEDNLNRAAASAGPARTAARNKSQEKYRQSTTVSAEGEDPQTTLHDYYVQTTFGDAFSEEARLARLRAKRSQELYADLMNNPYPGFSVRNSNILPSYARMNDGVSRYKRTASMHLGAYFTPEVIFYADDSIPNQRAYTFEITGKWKRSEFFLESGIGLSFSSDNGKYGLDYKKFLGTYEDVYNVTFDTLPGGEVVPVYHTNMVNVYDSISKFRLEQTKNRFTYLQVPLYIGFQKEAGRLGWFIKAGPILSILLYDNIPLPEAGNDQIIDLDQHMPLRVNTHWQLAFGAGISYKLSNKVSLSIEPVFKYYLNSQYERKYITTRHPYSLGLRTGLLFNF